MGRRHSHKASSRLPRTPTGGPRATQRGAYAIEFAFTFLILFSVIYMVIALAVIFAGNQLMTLAAEDGARAALRAGTWDEREDEACRVAERRADLFSGTCSVPPPQADDPLCRMSPTASGQCFHVQVVGISPIPSVPLLGPMLPSRLMGEAIVHLDTAGLVR